MGKVTIKKKTWRRKKKKIDWTRVRKQMKPLTDMTSNAIKHAYWIIAKTYDMYDKDPRLGGHADWFGFDEEAHAFVNDLRKYKKEWRNGQFDNVNTEDANYMRHMIKYWRMNKYIEDKSGTICAVSKIRAKKNIQLLREFIYAENKYKPEEEENEWEDEVEEESEKVNIRYSPSSPQYESSN